MAISCGHCKGAHESIAEVRACSTGGGVTTMERPASEVADKAWLAKLRDGMAKRADHPAFTVKQGRFLNELITKRDGALHVMDESLTTLGLSERGLLNKREASIIIDKLLTLPVLQNDAPTLTDWTVANTLAEQLPNVKRCHYAVNIEGVWKFYRIEKPQEGKWAGNTFMKVQASDDYHPMKSPVNQIVVYKAILEMGVENSLSEYGHQIGQCGICSRTLTDPESIARGIGPVCADRAGL